MQYITGFIAGEWKIGSWRITSSREEFLQYNDIRINYSDTPFGEKEIWIKPHSLLFETGIRSQTIDYFMAGNHPAFFKTEGEPGFDVLAASFYLLSRYEEYLPHTKDSYGRYAVENSLAYQKQFLTVPLVNRWLADFRDIVKGKFSSAAIASPTFSFLPTYDIDIAWSYKHKGWWRNTGGLLRSLLKGEWSRVTERISVLRGKQRDPFDAYGWMNQLHEKHGLKPYYFFPIPQKRGRFDKNVSPARPALQKLIQEHSTRYPIGIHPSWISGDQTELLKKEIDTLARITGNEIRSSRQHYIRFTLPTGYRRLIEHGIRYDFSMGYGSINGFRASVASPFYWYDLEKEEQTELLLFPFCYMEANSYYEQKFTPEQALEEMRHYYQVVKEVNGFFSMIWHNSFLGTDKEFTEWRKIYEQFVQELSAR